MWREQGLAAHWVDLLPFSVLRPTEEYAPCAGIVTLLQIQILFYIGVEHSPTRLWTSGRQKTLPSFLGISPRFQSTELKQQVHSHSLLLTSIASMALILFLPSTTMASESQRTNCTSKCFCNSITFLPPASCFHSGNHSIIHQKPSKPSIRLHRKFLATLHQQLCALYYEQHSSTRMVIL